MSMEGSGLFHRFIRRFLENQSRYFLVAKIVLGVVGVVSVFAVSGTVYAAGGVGSGGGGGGGGGGHQSSYGWGWAVYQTSGPGPTSGFRNGTSWSSVQSTCNNANAKSVYAFIIYDSGGNGEAYDYHTIYESPYQFSGHFNAGTSVDHSRATAINTSTAQSAFNSLPSKGVSTAGFTFGVNVAWFCYDLPSSASLDGVKIDNSRVSSSGSSSGYGGNYSGQQFSDDKVTVSGVGSSTGNPFSFKNIPAGTHTISVQDSGTSDTNWQVFGYSICKGASSTDVGSCTTQWLTQSGNISGGSSFSYKFVAGGYYHMRWIFAPKGSPPPVVSGACPMQPSANVAAVRVTLPASTGNTTTYGTDSSGNQTKIVRYVTGYNVKSVRDANSDSPMPTVPMPSPSTNTSGTFNIDFSNLVKAYPYDTNAVTVTYTTNYSGDLYTSTDGGKTWNLTQKGVRSAPPGTPWGPFTYTGGSPGGSGGVLGECNPIHFNVDTVTANSTSLNNYENPSTASLTSAVSVHLWGSQGGSKRSALSVNGLTDAVSYTIRHVDGSTYPLGASTPVSTSCGGGSTIDCPASASPSTSVTSYVGSAQNQFRPGDVVCAAFTISPQKGDTDTGGTIQNGQPGTASPSGPTGPSNSVCSAPVVNEPYFKVFGGDVSAGNTFEVTNGVVAQCVSSVAAANASVYGWNTAGSSAYNPNQYIKNLPDYNDSSSPYYHVASNAYAGAGAQLSIMAINNINGVASGQNNVNADDAPNNTKGNGLAFANASTSPSTGLFATAFGKAPACVPDYYADKPGTPPSLSGSIPATADGAYSLSGSTITGGTIGAGKHVVVYATGTVNITGNITFAGGTYAINDIPSFVLVVKGNINIKSGTPTAPGVTRLDGIYIAQPTDPANPTDGTLSDCLEASADRTNLWSACANPLTVNGSFIANKIYLLRTSNGDPGSYNESASIRAALSGESNSLTSTYVVDAQQIATCTSGVPDANGYCGNATPHTTTTSGSSYTASSYSTYSCPSGTYEWNNTCYSTSCGAGHSVYEGNCYNNWDGKLIGPQSGSPATKTTTYYCPSGGSLSGTTCTIAGTSSTYYTCPSGESVVGTRCKAKITYTCTDGSTPDSSHKCTIRVTPTHASEVFNYSPAFWLTLSLQNASSQNALKYDSVTSLPPVL